MRIVSIGAHRALASALCAAILPACLVGPDYARPQMDVAQAYDNTQRPVFRADPIEAAWWTSFNDSLLTRLIGEAYARNHDLRIADANLRDVRESLLQAKLDRFPVAPASAGYSRVRLSEVDAPGLSASDRTTDLFFAGFDATWELDVYGRVRRAVEARRAEVDRFDAIRRDVMVLVSAEVARNYFQLRGDQERLGVAQRNAENQKSTYDLTESLLEGGRGTELDTARARAQLESTLATIPLLEAAIRQSIYRLSVLTGQQPSALVAELAPSAALPELPAIIQIGDPDALLQRRPDIEAAERALAAATARIGVETADLFPRLTIEGSFGVESDSVGELFEGGAGFFGIGPRLRWAAFDLARVRAQIRAADARAEAELAVYEVTVLEALEEVDARLVQFHAERVRGHHVQNANEASRLAADLARKRYQQGVTDFLTVLDAERRQLEAEDQLADSRTRSATALVALYKALGGGWESQTNATAGAGESARAN